MRAAADDVCGKYADIVPAETRNLMGFYVSLRRLLMDVSSISSPSRLVSSQPISCLSSIFMLRDDFLKRMSTKANRS